MSAPWPRTEPMDIVLRDATSAESAFVFNVLSRCSGQSTRPADIRLQPPPWIGKRPRLSTSR
jgi:hypothetical protein